MRVQLHADVAGVRRTIDVIVEGLGQVNAALKRLSKLIRMDVQKTFNADGPGWPGLAESTLRHREKVATGRLENKLKKELSRAEKTAKSAKTIERRLSTLAEFRRLEAGGRIDAALLPEKQSSKLRERMDRSKKKSSEKLLGGIARSISAKVSGGTLTVESSIPWAGVHNDGGSAGHGATIPKRTFLEMKPEYLDALESFILDEVEKKLGE